MTEQNVPGAAGAVDLGSTTPPPDAPPAAQPGQTGLMVGAAFVAGAPGQADEVVLQLIWGNALTGKQHMAASIPVPADQTDEVVAVIKSRFDEAKVVGRMAKFGVPAPGMPPGVGGPQVDLNRLRAHGQ